MMPLNDPQRHTRIRVIPTAAYYFVVISSYMAAYRPLSINRAIFIFLRAEGRDYIALRHRMPNLLLRRKVLIS